MRCKHCGSEWNSTRPVEICPFCNKPLSDETHKLDTIEDVIRYIVQLRGEKVLYDGSCLLSYFADLAPNLEREYKMLHYFIECNGNTVFLNARNDDKAEQQAKITQIVMQMCNQLMIAENASRAVCASFWRAINGSAASEPEISAQAHAYIPDAAVQNSGGDKGSNTAQTANDKGFYPLKEKAEQGDKHAQNKLGIFFYKSDDMPGHYEEAFKYFSQAAEQGLAEAQFNLGRCYEVGNGCEKNISEAMKWYHRAAVQGDLDAQNRTGIMLHASVKELDKKIAYYKKEADSDSKSGNEKLASQNKQLVELLAHKKLLYYSEAFIWFKQAAQAGHTSAQYNLARCYEDGLGIDKSIPSAKTWYEKAAAKGHEGARLKLANLR